MAMFVACRSGSASGTIKVDVSVNDTRAIGGKRVRNGTANALGGAGDQRDTPFQINLHAVDLPRNLPRTL
jgi:hypothetical protein